MPGGKDMESLVHWRDLVIQDRYAIDKWPMVADHIVPAPVDRKKIQEEWKRSNYERAILTSLEQWDSSGRKVELLGVLRQYGLNTLADKIGNQSEAVNPPVFFGVGPLVHNFTGRHTEIQKLHAMLTTSHSQETPVQNVICISGLGGVGKSSLAKKYIYDYRGWFGGNTVWLNAESKNSLENCFKNLAKVLAIPVEENEQGHLIAERCYDWFRDKKCLFVFDNVEELQIFKQFRPKMTEPYVLVTSRRKDLTPIEEKLLVLEVFTLREAIDLVKSVVTKCVVEDCAKLAEKLQRFPLALQQALAYIRETYYPNADCITKYLAAFQKSAEVLLDDARFQDFDPYELTTLTTWNMTLERIKNMSGGPSAINLINHLSYLNPGRISFEFLQCLRGEEAEQGAMLLGKFSMINIWEQILEIHRIVQLVIRLNLECQAELNAVHDILTTVDACLPLGQTTYTEFAKECVSHGLHLFRLKLNHWKLNGGGRAVDTMNFWSKVCTYLICHGQQQASWSIAAKTAGVFQLELGQNHECTVYMKWLVADSLISMGDTGQRLPEAPYDTRAIADGSSIQLSLQSEASSLVQEEEMVSVCQRTEELKITASHNALAHRDGDRAVANHSTSNYDLAMAVLSDILPLVYDRKDPLTIHVLGSFVRLHSAVGNREEALVMYDRLIPIQISLDGEEDSLTITYKRGKAITLFELGRFDEARPLFEHCTEILLQVGSPTPTVLATKIWIGDIAFEQKNLTTALEIYMEVHDSFKTVFGEMHPSSLNVRNKLVVLLNKMKLDAQDLLTSGEFQAAHTMFGDGYKSAAVVLGPNHEETWGIRLWMGIVTLQLGDIPGAIEILEQVYAGFKELLGESDENTLGVKSMLESLRPQLLP